MQSSERGENYSARTRFEDCNFLKYMKIVIFFSNGLHETYCYIEAKQGVREIL